VIDDHPLPVALCVDERVPGRQAFTLPVLTVGKRVIAAIDRHITVDPNQLVAKRNFVIRQGFEGVDHVVSNGVRVVAALGRQGSQEYRLANRRARVPDQEFRH